MEYFERTDKPHSYIKEDKDWFGNYDYNYQFTSSKDKSRNYALIQECHPNNEAANYRVNNIPAPGGRRGKNRCHIEKQYEIGFKIENCVYIVFTHANAWKYLEQERFMSLFLSHLKDKDDSVNYINSGSGVVLRESASKTSNKFKTIPYRSVIFSRKLMANGEKLSLFMAMVIFLLSFLLSNMSNNKSLNLQP